MRMCVDEEVCVEVCVGGIDAQQNMTFYYIMQLEFTNLSYGGCQLVWPQYGGVRGVGRMRVVHWSLTQQHSAVVNSAREGGWEGVREEEREGEKEKERIYRGR